MKRFKLSNSEEILMDTCGGENRPLTTLQLAEKVTEARWNTNYIDKLLGQLVKRHGAGQRSAAERTLSVAAVRPLLHQGRISGEHARGQGVNQALFARIAVALFKNLPNQTNPSRKKS